MKTTSLPTALLVLAALPMGRAAAQAPFAFGLQYGATSFSWTGSTNQGPLSGMSQSFGTQGAVGLDVVSDAQGIHSGRFMGADATIQPDIHGQFTGGSPNSFQIAGARITLVSPAFAVAPGGGFTTTVTPTFLDGDLAMTPPIGVPSFSPLDGLTLQPVTVSGTLTHTASGLRLVAPLVLVFNFAVSSVNGSLTMSGVLTADLDCPDPISYCVTSPSSAGPGALIATDGLPSVSANQVVLRASGVPALQNGLFFYGASTKQSPFGNGVLCVGAPQFRLPVVTSTPAGDVTYALDIGAPPSPDAQIVPGASWNFQLWYRDPAAGGAFFNLSDGVRVYFCP